MKHPTPLAIAWLAAQGCALMAQPQYILVAPNALPGSTTNGLMIAGRVVNALGPVSNATVSLGGSQSRMATTNLFGEYSIENIPAGGNYTLSATKPGETFLPASYSFPNLQATLTVGFATAGLTAPSAQKSLNLTGGRVLYTPAAVNAPLNRWRLDTRLHAIGNVLFNSTVTYNNLFAIYLLPSGALNFVSNQDSFYCQTPSLLGQDVSFRYQRLDGGYQLLMWQSANPNQPINVPCNSFYGNYDPSAPSSLSSQVLFGTNSMDNLYGDPSAYLAYYRLYDSVTTSNSPPTDQATGPAVLRWEFNGNGQEEGGSNRHLAGYPSGTENAPNSYVDTPPLVGGGTTSGGAITVTTSPASLSLNAGMTASITANVTGTGVTGVAWTPSHGASGNFYNYVAPPSVGETFTQAIRAVSLMDASKYAETTVTLVPIGIQISSGSGGTLPTSVQMNQQVSVRATTSGVLAGANPNVIWSGPGIAAGTGTGNGASLMWTAPAAVGPAVLRACSVQDSNRCAEVAFSVGVATLQVSPSAASSNPASFTLSIGRGDVARFNGNFSTSASSNLDLNFCRFEVQVNPARVWLYATSGVRMEPGIGLGQTFPVTNGNCDLNGSGFSVSQTTTQTTVNVNFQASPAMASTPRVLWSSATLTNGSVIGAANLPTWSAPIQFTMSIDPPSVSIGPNSYKVLDAIQTAPTYLPGGGAAGSSWSVNGGFVYTPAAFLAQPAPYGFCFGSLGCLYWQGDFPQSSRRMYVTGNFSTTQTATVRAANFLYPSVFAERVVQLAWQPPPEPTLTGSVSSSTVVVNQPFTVSLVKGDVTGTPSNLSSVDFYLSSLQPSAPSQLGPQRYCRFSAMKSGGSWLISVSNTDGDQGQAFAFGSGFLIGGRCQIDLSQSTVTETATTVTMNLRMVLAPDSGNWPPVMPWAGSHVYLTKIDQATMAQFYLSMN